MNEIGFFIDQNVLKSIQIYFYISISNNIYSY